MKGKLVRYSTIAAIVLCAVVAGVYANEAAKEVRILCGLFKPGNTLASVEQILGTANLLHVETAMSKGYRHLEISSWYNFRMTGCSVKIEDDLVTEAIYRPGLWGL